MSGYGILCCIVLGLLIAGCGNRAEDATEESDLVPVITRIVHEEYTTRPILCQGTAHPLSQQTLSFLASGTVSDLFAPAGKKVSEGDTLAVLDRSLLTQEWVQRGLNLIAERNRLKRLREPLEQGVISQEEYDAAKEKVSLLVDVYHNAKAARKKIALVAPFNGRIVTWYISPGASVTAGHTAALLADFDPQAIARVELSEQSYHRIREGDAARVIPIDKLNLPLDGKVQSIYLTDNVTGLPYTADILFENPGGAVSLGTRLTASISGQYREKLIVIPRDALIEKDVPNGSVFLTDAKGKFAVRRHVLLGPEIGRDIIIDKGLRRGERLIVHGQDRLEQGTRIFILE